MATAYTRDRLTSLRNNGVLLNHRVCLQVSQLGLTSAWLSRGSPPPLPSTGGSQCDDISQPSTYTRGNPGHHWSSDCLQTMISCFEDVTHVRPYRSRRLSASMHISRCPQLRRRVCLAAKTTTTEPFLCPPLSTFRSETSAQTVPWNIEADCAACTQGPSFSITFQEDIRIGMKSIDRSDSTKSACQRRLRLRRPATT